MRFLTLALTIGLGLSLPCVGASAQDPGAASPKPARKQAGARANYPPRIDGAKVEHYQSGGKERMSLYVFQPADRKPGEARPAAVFFFGGGWTNGSPAQFEPHCRYLASRGMVAVAVDYRVASRHQTKVADAIIDAKSAMRWVRAHTAELGVDPQRIAAGGGSAGGHLAASCALLPGFDESGEPKTADSTPNALLLFNPALALAPLDDDDVKAESPALERLVERFGAKPKDVSPAHHVRSGAPPTIIFHGRDDQTVPFASIEAFAKRMKASGARCDVAAYAGKGHGFFNVGRGDAETVRETFRRMDAFLVSLGWIRGEATSDAFLSQRGGAPQAQAKPESR